MTDLITAEEAEKMLDGTTPGLTDHCLYHCGKRVAECPCMRDLAAKHALATAAPDLARALIASEAARKLAEERLAKALVAREKIKAAYEELLATVHGECPSLINEDSGGSQVLLDLILAADEAITTIKELNE